MHAEGGAATLIRDECRQTNGTLLRRYGSDVRCVMGEDAERVTCLSVCMCIVLWPVRVLIECAPPWASPRRPEPNKDPDVRRVYHLPQIHRPWIHMIVIVCRPCESEASITSNEMIFTRARLSILIRTSRLHRTTQ
jgi:hypothetical protein